MLVLAPLYDHCAFRWDTDRLRMIHEFGVRSGRTCHRCAGSRAATRDVLVEDNELVAAPGIGRRACALRRGAEACTANTDFIGVRYSRPDLGVRIVAAALL